MRHEIKEVENSNCLFDNVEKCSIVDTIFLNKKNINVNFAHDYVKVF